jgi:protein-disulfide isomerase
MTAKIYYEDFDATRAITRQTLPPNFRGNTEVVLDNIVGDERAPAVCIEYIDFQCPLCRDLSPAMHNIIKQFKDRGVAFVGRYFPLPQHANAVPAAAAVEAAARQGRFMAMSHVIFIGQPEWQDLDSRRLAQIFAEYAHNAGLDVTRWSMDYENAATNGIADKIAFQMNLGERDHVNGTPTVEINGRRLDVASKAAIISELEDDLAVVAR